MSRTIENRVVEMQFQNKQFEDAVAQSRQSIQLLEKDLKLFEGVQALKNLDTKVQSIDFSSMANGIQTLTDRFSTLGIISMSALNSITSYVTSGMLNVLNKITSSFSGLFSLIYQKGLTRANNLEQARFSMTGLLKDTNKVNQVMQIVNKSVDGTAYGLDEAARAASTLVATYGASSAGLNSVEGALHAIVGVAAQTNRSFEDVSHIFSTVAGNGKVMSMQLNQLAGYGLNAAAAIADYLNEETKVSKALRKQFKVGKSATEAEVRDLVSKGKITSDIFNAAFEKFYENAEKANDTLDGAISNVKAALGRIGAEFISPIITEKSPLVKFFNALRVAINNVKKALVEFKIPKNVTDVVNKVIDVIGTLVQSIGRVDVTKFKILEKISEAFRKFGMSLAGSIEVIMTALSPTTSNVASWEQIYHERIEELRAASDYVNKSYRDIVKDIVDRTGDPYSDIYRAFDITKDTPLLGEIENEREAYDAFYNKLINTISYNDLLSKHNVGSTLSEVADHLKILTGDSKTAREAFGDLVDEIAGFSVRSELVDMFWRNDKEDALKQYSSFFKSLGMTYEQFEQTMYDRALDNFNNIMFGGMTIGQIKDEAQRRMDTYKEYYDSIPALAEKYTNDWIDKLTKLNPFRQDIYEDLIEVFTTIVNSLTKVHSLAKEALADIIGDENIGVLSYLFGKDADPRNLKEKINGIMNWINERLTKFKLAIYNNSDTIRDIFRGVWASIELVVKVFKALWKIGQNAIKSFTPLFKKIFDLFGIMSGTFADLENNFTFDKIVDKVSEAIDIFAKVVENGFDKFLEFFNLFSPENIPETLVKFYNILKIIGEYLYTNFPIWFEKATPYIDKFNDFISEASSFLKDKLGVALEFISPYIEDFANWISDMTGGVVNLKEPIEDVKDVLEEASPVIETVNGSIKTVSDTIKATFGDNSDIDDVPKKFTNIKASLKIVDDIIEDMKRGYKMISNYIEDSKSGITVIEEKASFIQTIMEGVKNWFQKVSDWSKKTFDKVVYKIKNSEFINNLKENFEKLKKWIEEFDIDRILDVISRMVAIFSGGAVSYGTASMTSGIGKFLKEFPKMAEMVTAAIQSYNPMVMELKRVDNTTTRLNSVADILKSLAEVIGMIAVVILAIAASLWIISMIDETRFSDSIKVMYNIFGLLVSLITIILSISALGNYKGKTQANSSINVLTANRAGMGYILDALADVILVIGLSILMIVASLWIISQIPEDKLDRSIKIFEEIMWYMILLVGIIILFASLMKQRSSGTTGGTGSLFGRYSSGSFSGAGDWKILIAMAAIIFVIGLAVSGIMVSLALIANLPMNHLDKALDVFIMVVGGIITLMAVIGLFAVLLNRSDSAVTAKGSITPFLSLIGMAVILLIIGKVVKEIMTAIALISHLPMNNLTSGLTIFGVVVLALIVLIGVIGGLTLMLNSSAFNTTSTGKLIGSLLSLAAVLFIIGEVLPEIMLAMTELILLVSAKDIKAGDITTAVGILAVIVAAIGIILVLIAGTAILVSKFGGTQGLVAIGLIIGIFAAIALLAVAMGYMISSISESGMGTDGAVEIITAFTIALIAILAVVAIIGAISTSSVYVAIGIAVVAALILVLAALAWAMGTMVKDIAIGANILVDAIVKFVTFFSILNDKQLKKVGNNIRSFFKNLSEAIIDSIIEFAKLIEKRRIEIELALVTIISLILSALSTAIFAIVKSWLDNLTVIIGLIHDFLEKNIGNITDILEIIAAIVYVFLSGKDGRGGFIGNLISIIGNALYVLWYGGNDWVGILNFIAKGVTDLIKLIKEEGPKIADTLGWLIDDILSRMRNAITNPEQLEKFKATIDDFINMIIGQILKDLGFIDENGKDKSETKGSEIMNTFIASMFIPAVWNVAKVDWSAVTKWISDVCGKIREGFLKVIHAEIPLATMIISALNEDLDEMSKSGNKVAETLLYVTRNVLGIKSPSKEFYKIGKFCIQGLVNAFKDGGALVTKEAQKTGDLVMDPVEHLKSRLKLIFSSLTNDMASSLGLDSFTITPTMDLTQITEGFGDIQSMMNGNSSFDISALSGSMTDSLSASDTASGFDEANAPDSGFLNGLDTETIVNFTQNNYSPESLSRIDIYRDTKNILSNPSAISQIVTALK